MNASPLPTLDGVRAIACLLVLGVHCQDIGLPHGPPIWAVNAVKLFFTLSGFLMAYHYLPGEKRWRYWAAYLTRRFFRVYLVFAFVMMLYWLLFQCGVTIPHYEQFDTKRLIAQLLFRRNIHTYWTIGVEIAFYLLVPLIGLVLLALRPPPKIQPALLAASWLATMYWASLYNIRSSSILVDYVPYFAYFMGGAWAASVTQAFDMQRYLAVPRWQNALLLCIAVADTLAFSASASAWPFQDQLTCILFTISMIAVTHPTGWCRGLLANRPIRFIGAISYSIYVCHRLVFGVEMLAFPAAAPLPGYCAFALTFAVAWMFHRAIERPFNACGRQLAARMGESR